MANLSLPDADQGVYEITLVAKTVQTIAFESPGHVIVLVHSGDAPVYARSGEVVTVKEGRATMVPPGGFSDVPGSLLFLSLISAANATVSVSRN